MIRKAEDYLKNVTALTIREELYNIGKQMQIDAIEETVKLCTENAEANVEYYAKDYGYPSAVVCKSSILNCAKILKKQLE